MDKSLKKIASSDIFQPYFKARYQNMQNIINDSQIISFIPRQFTTYYTTYVRQWLQWATGFVPMLHRNEFFSTGIGASIIKIFVRELMNGGYRFDSEDKDVRLKIQQWAERMHFDNLLNEMFWNSNAVGNAFIKLTPVDGDVIPSVFSSVRAYVEIDRLGKVSKARFLNRFVSNTVNNGNYWAKEERVFVDNVPYFKVMVGTQSSMATSPAWNFNEKLITIPEALEEEWQNTYGDIRPNTWYELPFKSLGVYNVKNEAVAIALADMPGYSDSSLHTALDVLYSIDFNFTSSQMDMYWGRTRVLLPKPMQPRRINPNVIEVSDGITYQEAMQAAPLEDDVFTKLDTPNEEQSPYFIQPDQRGEAHKQIRDSELELLAMKLGLSATTLGNHLRSSGHKTATQIINEDDTTAKTVNNKRNLANVAINDMLAEISNFYDWDDVPDITWNRASGFSAEENKFLLEQYNAGVLPLKEYLKKVNRDLTSEEVDDWVMQLQQAKDVMSLPIKNSKGVTNGTI